MDKIKSTAEDSIACMVITGLFYLTAFFTGLLLMGLRALVASSAGLPSYGTGAEIAGIILIGGGFTILGVRTILAIWRTKLTQKTKE